MSLSVLIHELIITQLGLPSERWEASAVAPGMSLGFSPFAE